MNAKPHPGKHAVGGATPQDWGALALEVAENTRHLVRELSAAHPGQAAIAALAFQTNQAITRQVSLSYALAMFARAQATSIADAGEQSLPDGALRAAVTGAARLQADMAADAAKAATDFGRHFGHMAFAFPR
jgi:hypothetical protein